MVKPFHELTPDEYKALAKTKMTYGELAKEYPQPDWCNYHDALEGVMGCWALVSCTKIKSKKDCGTCDCIIEEGE